MKIDHNQIMKEYILSIIQVIKKVYGNHLQIKALLSQFKIKSKCLFMKKKIVIRYLFLFRRVHQIKTCLATNNFTAVTRILFKSNYDKCHNFNLSDLSYR